MLIIQRALVKVKVKLIQLLRTGSRLQHLVEAKPEARLHIINRVRDSTRQCEYAAAIRLQNPQVCSARASMLAVERSAAKVDMHRS